MKSKFKAAVVQMNTTENMAANLVQAERLVREAAVAGAKLIVTPEYTNVLMGDMTQVVPLTVPQEKDPCLARMRLLARELGVWIHVGSLAVRADEQKIYNRSFLLNDKGDIVATYDKIHLFDVDLPNGEVHRESDKVVRGKDAPVVDTPFGRLGLVICYDLRFPEMFQDMWKAGAEIFLVPAAYTEASGLRTWTAFTTSRAAETGCYVLASAQAGIHGDKKCWGHSCIVEPLGDIAAQTKTAPNHKSPDFAPGIVVAEIDRAKISSFKSNYPIGPQKKDSPYNVVNVAVASPAP